MLKEPLISTAPQGKFTLRPSNETTNIPGIERKVTDDSIEVTYQSRFALFDESTMSSKPCIQEKKIKT